MAEQLLDQVRDLVEGQIDFEGQKLAETLATVVLSAVGAVSFLVGYFLQDIALALKIGLGGTVLTLLLTVPPWPFFNRNKVEWLPRGGGGSAITGTQQNIVIDEKLFSKQ